MFNSYLQNLYLFVQIIKVGSGRTVVIPISNNSRQLSTVAYLCIRSILQAFKCTGVIPITSITQEAPRSTFAVGRYTYCMRPPDDLLVQVLNSQLSARHQFQVKAISDCKVNGFNKGTRALLPRDMLRKGCNPIVYDF